MARLGAAIDGGVEVLIVRWVRRQWPVLRLVPARWIRMAVAPTAVRVRRSASHVVLALTAPVGGLLALHLVL